MILCITVLILHIAPWDCGKIRPKYEVILSSWITQRTHRGYLLRLLFMSFNVYTHICAPSTQSNRYPNFRKCP